MKTNSIILLLICLFVFNACYTSSRISKFSSEEIELGMTKDDFIRKYGKPFNKELSYTQDNRAKEDFFYKEELYKGSWFIITTAFTFIDGKLTKQEIVNEERSFQRPANQ